MAFTDDPNPHHLLYVFDLERRSLLRTVELRPRYAPHTIRLGIDGMIYVNCEGSGDVAVIDPTIDNVVAAIDVGSTNCHRLAIAPDGRRLYTENEEDATISVVGLPERRLLGKIAAPRPLAGIAVLAGSKTLVAVDDVEPALHLVDTRSERIVREMQLKDVPKPAQIARFSPDWSVLGVSSMSSNTVTLIDPAFGEQSTIGVGSQPMDMAFHGNELFVACQGDGTVHVIDLPSR